MKINCYSTGTVTVTRHWQVGNGGYLRRFFDAIIDKSFTEPLPIWCYLIEHPEGLILIDTGIPNNANAPIWMPPHMRLIQRAATFQIDSEAQEIGPQLYADGFSPEDVRWVVLTHLHQDHDGGLHHFPNAEVVVTKAEWNAAQGFAGRMAGYLNQRWPTNLNPTCISFEESDPSFGQRHTLTQEGDVYLVPTAGHSGGHLSVICETEDISYCFAGDASYSQDLLLANALDGVGQDAAAMRDSHQRILIYASRQPTMYLPSHEWAARERLQLGQTIPVTQQNT